MKIAVIGSGYIGLVTGVCLTKIGHEVICVDKDATKIAGLRRGEVPIFEPDLVDLMMTAVNEGRLTFTTDTAAATRQSDAIMIAVGTPTASNGTSTDLSYVFAAASEIAAGADSFKVIIVKSTVPPGTTRRILDLVQSSYPGCDIEVASNPEFLREGSAIFDFMNPSRIVIGAETPRARAVLDRIYTHFTQQPCEMVHTGFESAELIKFASNGFLATKVAFINEVAELCEKTGANVRDVARGMGLDERIGPKFLNAGPGFGGSCFPKDLRAMVAIGKAAGARQLITEAAISANEHAKRRMVENIVALAGGSIAGLKLAIFGVTFKPDTDDMREAPALDILPALAASGASLRVVDPEGQHHGAALLPMVSWLEDPYTAAEGAHMIVVLTEWAAFRELDLSRLAHKMAKPAIADLRNIYSLEALKKANFVKLYQVGHRA